MVDDYLGVVKLFSGEFPPPGWQFYEGQEIFVWANTLLFTIIGTKFGGDGFQSSPCPILENTKVYPGCRYIICITGFFPGPGNVF